jgi:hypothetical protein
MTSGDSVDKSLVCVFKQTHLSVYLFPVFKELKLLDIQLCICKYFNTGALDTYF